MEHQIQVDRARAFRAMHGRGRHGGNPVLLLPNAWDAGSARLFAQRGFAAIATTSGGMAWSLGHADGEQAPLAEVLAAIARMTRVVELPLTVDIETGYGDTPQAVAGTVQAVIAAGAVGINIEDGAAGHGPLRPVAEAVARVRAAREAADASGVPIVINARVDHWLQPEAIDPAGRLDDAVQRGKAYLAAGADCIYPIGLGDRAILAALAQALDAPINVAAGAGMPDLAELARLGVARVSTATRLATLALGAVDRAVRVMLESGRFDGLTADFSYADAQRLFVPD
ncbi:isocitrate lyase/PEP mutase family protein [Rhodanobacter ginsengiterrae]|uniref:isocitrate lyase/PEP mutase family protein n=1 Tax=Rhodanobacter ginsengiterrae TaxID=2008451 RepID=UPI003CEC9CC0